MNVAEKTESVREAWSALDPAQRAILALTAAVQTRSIAMAYLESKGKLNTFYKINEGVDGLRRVVRGKAAPDVEQLDDSLAAARRQMEKLEASEDSPADLAADAIEISVLVMEHFREPAQPLPVDVVLAACDLASRLAEEVAESSGADEESPLVQGDSAAEGALDSFLEVIDYLRDIRVGDLPQHATKIVGMAGAMNLRNGGLMQSLVQE